MPGQRRDELERWWRPGRFRDKASAERPQELPFEASVGYQLRMANRATQRYLQSRIEPFGVTLGMWYFLRALWEADGLTQRELSRRIGTMEPTTLTALAAMERAGLVTRRARPQGSAKAERAADPEGAGARTSPAAAGDRGRRTGHGGLLAGRPGALPRVSSGRAAEFRRPSARRRRRRVVSLSPYLRHAGSSRPPWPGCSPATPWRRSTPKSPPWRL